MSLTSASPRLSVSRSTKARLGWLHVCNGLNPRRDGGMVPSILGFTGSLAEQGGDVTIVTPTPSDLQDTALPSGVELRSPADDLEGWVRNAGIVHFHGLWQGHTRRGARTARQAGIPYLIAAHGMAEPWALRHKALRKWAYTTLIEGKNLRRASCLHALSRPEVRHLRALAPKTPICLVPNGVDLRPFETLPPRSELESHHPELRDKFVLLFLSRLHVKKGLDLLASAMEALMPRFPNLHLLVAGHDDGARSPFESRMLAAGLGDRFTYLGHVSGIAARRAWSAADAFVLPSYSEGFSMAILEALACRLPVVITTACHFPELGHANGGIVVQPTILSVTDGLRNLLEQTPSERAAMAARGRALVDSRYTWNQQAKQLTQVYDWIRGGGLPPETVEI